MSASDRGIVRNQRGEEQPADKDRAQTAHKSDAKKSASPEATRQRRRWIMPAPARPGAASGNSKKVRIEPGAPRSSP